MRVFLRFFFSPSAAGAVFFDVFLAAAGALDAEGCLVAVDEAGALPAVEAGLGAIGYRCECECVCESDGRGYRKSSVWLN